MADHFFSVFSFSRISENHLMNAARGAAFGAGAPKDAAEAVELGARLMGLFLVGVLVSITSLCFVPERFFASRPSRPWLLRRNLDNGAFFRLAGPWRRLALDCSS
jgi:hypothetical protein